MGCAGCKLLRHLKREKYIEELVGVDIDSLQLFVHQPVVYPLTTDFLNPRQMPLLVKLMQGSISLIPRSSCHPSFITSTVREIKIGQ